MEEPAVQMVEVEGDCRKEEGKEVLPAGEGMEPVEVFFCTMWLLGNSWGHTLACWLDSDLFKGNLSRKNLTRRWIYSLR